MFRFLKRTAASGAEDDPTHLALLRILELNKEMAGAERPERLPDRILDAAIELVGAERGFLIRNRASADGAGAPRPSDEWDVVAARNIDQENVRKALKKVSHSITSQVLETGEPFLSADAVNDDSIVPAASVADLKLRSVLCVPMHIGRLEPGSKQGEGDAPEISGCLYVDNRFAHGRFDETEKEILEAFADQAALALERVQLLADNECAREDLERANEQLKHALADQDKAMDSLRAGFQPSGAEALEHEYAAIIGRGRAMWNMLTVLDRVIEGDFPVLLCGASGTGKELVARALHKESSRGAGPFVAVNCGAIAESLLESELFGAVRGAYTGAVKDREGLLEAADGGVLFLDEIGEMSLGLQSKLLRVLQEKSVRRIGGNAEIPIDVRAVSATHRNLQREVARGTFREDLYYRLKVVQIDVPALRERREDIPALVDHFLDKLEGKTGKPRPELTEECLQRLFDHDWPGNVRELENEITRMVALGGAELGGELLSHLAPVAQPVSADVHGLVGRRMADVEAQLIRATLEATGGRRGDAARMLGIPRRTFYNRLKALGIE